ncbi:hypothetical protein PPERSA_10799 [Pseudocohnilembus persalinus]|uniref:STOP protein n=1 Tax=Pseudocohnilembus persalinus TaxID=266149 RepID=A0A0V0QDN7_PSEPJ|nr:hypothetical protein PPERSA_10799 [Pseudocohnilembus persalinus]|eukprot:KRX00300.1 hypothetical protein PPERSA_10799 [Pseudocohnilembus persalinus]
MGITQQELYQLQREQLQKGKNSKFVAVSRSSNRSAGNNYKSRFQKLNNLQQLQQQQSEEPKISQSQIEKLLGADNPLAKRKDSEAQSINSRIHETHNTYNGRYNNYIQANNTNSQRNLQTTFISRQNSNQQSMNNSNYSKMSQTLSFRFKESQNGPLLIKKEHPSLYFKQNQNINKNLGGTMPVKAKETFLDNQSQKLSEVENNQSSLKNNNKVSKYRNHRQTFLNSKNLSQRQVTSQSQHQQPNSNNKNDKINQQNRYLYNQVFENNENELKSKSVQQKFNNVQNQNINIQEQNQKEDDKQDINKQEQIQQIEQQIQNYQKYKNDLQNQQQLEENQQKNGEDQQFFNEQQKEQQLGENSDYFKNQEIQCQQYTDYNEKDKFNITSFNSTGNFTQAQMDKFSSMLNKNEAYLKHLKGDCLCGRCTCGKCKCPSMLFMYDQDKRHPTSYNIDYSNMPQLEQNLPHITMKHHDTAKAYGSMDLQTTNQDFYKGQPTNKTQPLRGKEQMKRDFPFSSSTIYNQQFINWGSYKPLNMAPNLTQTTIPQLKFIDKSIYKDSYNKEKPQEVYKKDPNSEFIKDWQKRPNLRNPNFNYLSETTNNKFFKPQNHRNEINKAPQQEYMPMPTYKGQFQSNQQVQFKNTQPIQCPSRKELNQLYKSQVKQIESDAIKYQKELLRQ